MHHACSRLTSRPPSRDTNAELPRLVIRTCKHILDRGTFCRAPAMNGRDYCHSHLRLRLRLRRMARARRRLARLKLPPLIDRQAVQTAAVRVRAALAGGHIDSDRAGLIFYGLQMIAANLRSMECWPTSQTQVRSSPQERAGPCRHPWQQKGSWVG